MTAETKNPGNGYPEGDNFTRFLRRRKRVGAVWGFIFLLSTTIGVIILAVLIADILNDAFGYVAIKYKVDPVALTVNYYKQKITTQPNTLTSEDDQVLVNGVAARPAAVGFFGYAYYQQNAEKLRAVPLDGIEPNEETVAEDAYPLARPLFIYADQAALEEKSQVAAFVGAYLRNVSEIIRDIGYFPVSDEIDAENVAAWETITGHQLDDASASAAQGDLFSTGSSTVAPITQRIADDLSSAGQFGGDVVVENIGTDAGMRRFCIEGVGDLVNASRPMVNVDLSACYTIGRTPVGFRVANDGLPVVVSNQNDFVTGLSLEQLRQLFTEATKWNEIDPTWPDQNIFRFVPGVDSGTLDFFVAELFGTELASQPKPVLIDLLTANISAGRLNALEAQQPLTERSEEELLELLEVEVLQPKVVASWTLLESIFNRTEIEAEAAAMPGVDLQFKSWITWEFITSPQSSDPLQAGVRTAILGSLWVTIIAALMAVPLGVAAAIYLEEYSTGQSWLDRVIETNINNLAGVPSIIYGMLGLAVFVRFFGQITSGLAFGVGDPSTANGRTILSAGLTLGLLILPLVIINAREAIRAVPRGIREGSLGLGATKWQTMWHHVLPGAIPGILTGVILSVSRAFGETAPLIVVGVSTFIVVDPTGPFSKYTTLTAQIYQWTSRPQQEFRHLAAAGIIVLLFLLLAINAFAIWLRNRYSRRTM